MCSFGPLQYVMRILIYASFKLEGVVAECGLERWTGDMVVLGSNPAAAISLRNFGNSIYHALPVSFGRDTKSRRSLLSASVAEWLRAWDTLTMFE